jgi:hypothetical protein
MLHIFLGFFIVALGLVPLSWASRLFGNRGHGPMASLLTKLAAAVGIILILIGIRTAF